MRQYIIRRILISFVVLFGVSVLLYTLVRLMPSDYVDMSTAGNVLMTDEVRESLKAAYGLDKGVVEGYLSWVWSAFHGNLGMSFIYKKPVTQVIWDYAPITFVVAFVSLVLEILIAVPLGIRAARKQYSKTDYAIVFLAFMGISLPIFFFAQILKRVFGYYGLDWLPVSGMLTARATYESFTFVKFLDYAQHLVLPITCFVITSVGGLLRYTRTNMLEVLNSDYVRTARAKGLPERVVVNRHAFRNTLIPIVTMVGGMLPSLFSGAAITEGLFGLEGLGRIALDASYRADIPYLMGFNMFLAVMTLLGTLIADILYAVVDPRVKY